MPWDYAAAGIILTEAGGAISGFDGESPSLSEPSMCIAANSRQSCKRILRTVRRHLDALPY